MRAAPFRIRARGLARVAAALSIGSIVATLAVALPAVRPEAAQAAPAAALRAFDPGDIISDQVMFNPSTMSANAIQSFLNAQVPVCRPGYTCLKSYTQTTTTKPADPMCRTYTGARNETAATIIARVAAACGVNPQVLLVTLQKEQALVLDTWPDARQYRSATGYGCPDTAACDANYYGFFNQVYKAAWAFKRYTSPPGTSGPGWTAFNWFPVGRPTGILYNPSTSCGASTVTIKNKATAVLYYFTPYVPNPAALAAGYGEGDGCSAYGNRNFYLYFTRWFGSTHYTVTGAFKTLWTSLGGATGSLGNPLGNAAAVAGGSSQAFQRGTVYSSKSGTFALAGATLSTYRGNGGPASALGWPTGALRTSKANGGGTVQRFTGGGVYSSKAGTFAVSGDVDGAYRAWRAESGTLGWPVAAGRRSTVGKGGTVQNFSGGSVFDPADGAPRGLSGPQLKEYRRIGAEAGVLAWPRSSSIATTGLAGAKGTVQSFDGGSLATSARGVFAVPGAVATNWSAHGGAAGGLGWPTAAFSTSTANGGGVQQPFDGGTEFASPTAGAHPLSGATLTEYLRRGGVAGSLGWPTGGLVRSKAHGGGTSLTFQSGVVLSSKAGTFAVRLDLLAAYQKAGGPTGWLGWPKTGAYFSGKTHMWTQWFTGGVVRWTSQTGPKVTKH